MIVRINHANLENHVNPVNWLLVSPDTHNAGPLL